MRIYVLTKVGRRICKSVKLPDTSSYRILSFLNTHQQATPETIADFTGLDITEVKNTLSTLKRRGIVAELTGG